jgi:hypothetical protein
MLMLTWATGTILSALQLAPPAFVAWRGPARVRTALTRALGAVQQQPPVTRAAAMGLLTTLLPCGWLYTFVVAAGGSGSPLKGALVMAIFWLGTVPMMLSVGYGAQRFFGPLRQRLPVITASAVLVIGLLSITGHMQLTPMPLASHTSHTAVPHGHQH